VKLEGPILSSLLVHVRLCPFLVWKEPKFVYRQRECGFVTDNKLYVFVRDTYILFWR